MTKLSIPSETVVEAHELGINVSAVARAALEREIRTVRRARLLQTIADRPPLGVDVPGIIEAERDGRP